MILEKFKSLYLQMSMPTLTEKDCKFFDKACAYNDEETAKKILKTGKFPYDSKYVYTSIQNICKNGNVSLLEYLLTSPQTKAFHKIHLDSNVPLDIACSHAQLDVVKFLCESPKLKKHINLHNFGMDALKKVCYWWNEESGKPSDNFEIVKYILKDPNVRKSIASLMKINEEPSKSSAYSCNLLLKKLFTDGKIEEADFIINTLELKEHISIEHAEKYLENACLNSNRATVDYLLTSPNFKHSLNIYSKDSLAFKTFAYNENYSMVEHLIFDFNYSKSVSDNEFLENHVNEEVVEKIDTMLKIRDLNQKLEKELPSAKINGNKSKI